MPGSAEQALVKAVDFPPSRKTAAIAETLISETLRDPGAVEIGHAEDLRWSVGLQERAAEADPDRALGSETVFCVTGAAGSIVAAITADLAKTSQGTFHLLDLVAEPDPSDPDLGRFSSDPEGLKRDLAERIKERGERPTPKLVEREMSRIERARAALDAIEAIREAGGEAHWHQLDLTDASQVSAAIASALEQSGRIDVLIHCAGLEISHFLPDKPQSEFDLVFDVKVDGWFNLIKALARLRAARGGRLQLDRREVRQRRPDRLRGGQRPALQEHLAAAARRGAGGRDRLDRLGGDRHGEPRLDPEDDGDGRHRHAAAVRGGCRVVRRELTAEGPGREVLVAGSLGLLGAERHPTGGLDPGAATAAIAAHPGPMTGAASSFTSGEGLTVLTELDPADQAFLDHHRIEGIPVLPGVMGIEAFAEAAAALLPGWQVTALEDVELERPLQVLPRRAAHAGAAGAGPRSRRRRHGRRLPAGRPPLAARRASSGRCISPAGPFWRGSCQPRRRNRRRPRAARAKGSARRRSTGSTSTVRPTRSSIGPGGRTGSSLGRLAEDLPPDHQPAAEPTEAAPRLIELCFQTAGVWQLGTEGRMALPTHVDRITRFADADAPGSLVALVSPREDGSAIDARVVD